MTRPAVCRHSDPWWQCVIPIVEERWMRSVTDLAEVHDAAEKFGAQEADRGAGEIGERKSTAASGENPALPKVTLSSETWRGEVDLAAGELGDVKADVAPGTWRWRS